MTKIQETQIKNSAKRTFYRNPYLFHKVGLHVDDISSIFTYAAHKFFENDNDEKLLPLFLKQQMLKLIRTAKKSALYIPEHHLSSFEEYNQLEEKVSDAHNPENILIAKEEIIMKMSEIKSRLIDKMESHIENLIAHKAALFRKNEIKKEFLMNMVENSAIEFAGNKYKSGLPLKPSSLPEFKKIMAVKISRLIRDLENGR